ncbi:MAG: hypothetical protein AB7L90_19575 [Hyphomicrobiaceae bacterium]
MKEKHNALILGTHTWPEQDFYCKSDVKSIGDLKGKKIRVQGTSQSDLATAFDARSMFFRKLLELQAIIRSVVGLNIDRIG